MFPRSKKQETKQIEAGGDAIDWSNMVLGMMSVPKRHWIKKPKQKGGRNILYGDNLAKRLTPAWLERAIRSAGRPKKQSGGRLSHMDKGLDQYAAVMGVKNPYGQRGGYLAMRKLMMASQPHIFRGQRGPGLFSIFTRPLARLFGKKVTK